MVDGDVSPSRELLQCVGRKAAAYLPCQRDLPCIPQFCCFRERCLSLPHRFFCHLPSPQTRFFAGAAVRSPGSARYLQDQFTAAPVPLRGPHVPPPAFPALGSLLVFIMQLYSSQNRSLCFIHPFAMCLPEQGDIMLALQKAN